MDINTEDHIEERHIQDACAFSAPVLDHHKWNLGVEGNARWAYEHASLVGRFVQGEKYIAQDATYSVKYAHDVLHAPFTMGESVIAISAYQYAALVLQGRFAQGEAMILNNPAIALYYAFFQST